MLKSYRSSTQRSNFATIGLIALLGYISSVVELWRKNGIVYFFWVIIKRPVAMIDVHYVFFVLLGMLAYLFYMVIRAWGKSRLPFVVVLISLVIISGGALCLHVGMNSGIVKDSEVAGGILMQCLLITVLMYREMIRIDVCPLDNGVLVYLFKKAPVNKVWFMGVCSFLGAWGCMLFTSSCLHTMEIAVRCTLDGISVYILLFLILHTHIYNVNHFSKDIQVLSKDNQVYSIENRIVLTNYDDAQITENEVKSKNNQIIYEYALDLLRNVEEGVYSIVKKQKISKVCIEPKPIRKLPKMLLIEAEKQSPIIKNDITGSLLYKLYFFVFSRVVYERILSDIKLSQNIISKLTRVIWLMDLNCRKKLLQRIDDVRKDARKIIAFDTSDLTNILNVWSFHLST